jgi:EAL and modified HD-GYP domain-containing signal transduction protein
MLSFIKRLLGSKPATQQNPAPFKQAAPAPTSAENDTVRQEKIPAAVVQREEIIDDKTRIAGYRFSARRPDSAHPTDPQSTLEALANSHVARFAERRLALIPISLADWHALDLRPLIGPNTVFLLPLPGSPEEEGEWAGIATQIQQAGARIAVGEVEIIKQRKLVKEHAHFVVIDFLAYSLVNIEKTIRTLRAHFPKLRLIVENVSRWPEQRYCIAHGISFCLGPFTTAQDEEQQSGEIGQSRLVLIEMLNSLRQEAELTDIAQIAKRDPGVVVKLMAMANSPMLGMSQSVTGIDQAIMVLGRHELYRWLSIGMFRMDEGSPRDEVLLELALTRGHFLETIGQAKHSKAQCDELFLLGLLSLLDSLLGVPMSTVVKHIHLSPALSEVLLNSSGPLGRFLMLVIAQEKGHGENVARLAAQLEIPLETIDAAATEAQVWAENAVTMSA